jgi:hypothetical protein
MGRSLAQRRGFLRRGGSARGRYVVRERAQVLFAPSTHHQARRELIRGHRLDWDRPKTGSAKRYPEPC